MSISADLPPQLTTPFTDPPPERLERQSWQVMAAPSYIGLFLGIVFLDPLAARTLPVGGVAWSAIGALFAGLLCYVCLYLAPALWGMRTGYPLTIVGTSTFGVRGASWLAGLMMGLAQVVWFAVANFYATELVLEGLVSCGLLEPRHLRPLLVGPLRLQSPLFLFTALVWCYWSALTGGYLVRLISALMRMCPIFAAAMLGLAMLMTFRGLASFQPPGVDPVSGEPVSAGGWRAVLGMVQLVFAFFATFGAASVDAGAGLRDARDVQRGGLVGVVFAPWITATLALLTVAGGLGGRVLEPRMLAGLNASDYAFHQVVQTSIGGWVGALILLTFGLVALAPATFAAWEFSQRFAALGPRLPRRRWTLLGAAAAWLLIAPGIAGRLELIFGLMGAAFAPLVGALTADYIRQRGTWPGPRLEVNLAGLVAWAAGLAVGLVPTIARAWGRPVGDRFQPSAVFAYVAAMVVYLILAQCGAESPALLAPEPAEPSETP